MTVKKPKKRKGNFKPMSADQLIANHMKVRGEEEKADKENKELAKYILDNNIEDASNLAEREIVFIPDYDPDLSVEQNYENAAKLQGKQSRFLSSTEDEVLYAGTRGPLAFGEGVLTKDGFKNIEDIAIGDVVVCPDNSTTKVVSIPFEGDSDCYKITTIDGRSVTASKDHLWYVEKKGEWSLLETQDIYNHYKQNEGKKTVSLFLKPVQHVDLGCNEPLPLHPYLLGALLGDGSISGSGVRYTTDDPSIIYRFKDLGYNITDHSENLQYGITGISDKIDMLDIRGCNCYNKFIPESYMNASAEVRLEVVKGLMDSDGSAKDNCGATFTTVSEQLAKDLQKLIWSLGGKATLSVKDAYETFRNGKTVNNAKSYILYVRFAPKSDYFFLKRKQDRANAQKTTRPLKIAIKSVEPVGVKKTRCITIEDPRGLFITSNYLMTHNSAKSSALIADPLPYFGNKNFRGLMIRKAMPDLRELIKRCTELYTKAYPGTKWKEQSKMFVFPSGATMEMGYCDTEDDVERYRGQEYCWVGVDEIAQYNGPWIVDRLKASMRSPDPTLPIYFRCSCNPFGPGKEWLKERFEIIFDHESGIGNQEQRIIKEFETPVGTLQVTRKWFFGHWSDNKVLMRANPNYPASLAAIANKSLRDAELHGSWDAVVGRAFPEFKPHIHVVEPFDIPDSWYKWRACDWGYTSMAAVLWFAADWDNNVYVYREFTPTELYPDEFARTILSLERGEEIQEGYIDGSVAAERGNIGVSILESMEDEGLYWTPADRSKGSRIAGKQLVHKYLAPIEDPLDIPRAKLRIFSTCNEIIQELTSLQADRNNPEDVDKSRKTALPDHAYDALRYGLSAMPDTQVQAPSFVNNELRGRMYNPPPLVVNPKYGH
jgi:hypothetical protein